MSPQPPRTFTLITSPRAVRGSAWDVVRGSLRRWAVDSQRGACRNAMIAGTALAARRAEREEVEEYLAGRGAPRNAAPVPRPRPAADDAVAEASPGERTAHA